MGPDEEHARAGFAFVQGIQCSLALAVAEVESGFEIRPTPISVKGAIGVMQIMPETARLYGYDPSRLKEFRYNIRCGVGILKDLLRQFQDPGL